MIRNVAIFLLAAGSAVSAASAADASRWWRMLLAGQPAGYYHEQSSKEGTETVSIAEMRLVLNRLGSKVEMSTRTETRESGRGEFQSALSETRNSAQTVTIRAALRGDELETITEAGGKSYRKAKPAKEPLTGPTGLERLTRERLRKPGDALSVRIYAAETGEIATLRRAAAGIGERNGKQLLRAEDEIEGMPGKQTVLIDDDGRIVERRQTLPFGELVMEPATEAAALASQGGELPKEIYDSVLVRSNIRLPQPRSIDRIRLRIRLKNPDLGWPAMESAYQRVVEKSRETLVLEVRRPASIAAGSLTVTEDFRLPNPIIQSDDPEVMRIASEAAGTSADAAASASALQTWVARNVHFDAGIAMAPASEVARNRRGTCVAFATLLGALARSRGIPSRLAMGFVYVQGAWGGHAWTELLLDGRWVPLDSAIFSPGPADAARFALGYSSLSDGAGSLLAAAARLYGNVEIRVEEFESKGVTAKVPAGAPGHRISGDVYTNPWLGIALRKPAGAKFTAWDAVYPDASIVRIEDAEGNQVRLEVEDGSTPAIRLSATGKRAGRLFQAAAAGLRVQ